MRMSKTENAPIIVYPEVLINILNKKVSELGEKYDVINLERISSSSSFYFLDILERDIGLRTGKVMNNEELRDAISEFIENYKNISRCKDFILLNGDDGFIIFNIHHIQDIIPLYNSGCNRLYICVPEELYDADLTFNEADRTYFVDINLSETKKLYTLLEENCMYDILLKVGNVI